MKRNVSAINAAIIVMPHLPQGVEILANLTVGCWMGWGFDFSLRTYTLRILPHAANKHSIGRVHTACSVHQWYILNLLLV